MDARLLSCFVVSAGLHSMLAWQLRPAVQPPVLPLARGVVCVSLRASPGIVHGSQDGSDELKPADPRVPFTTNLSLPKQNSAEEPPQRVSLSAESPIPVVETRELLALVSTRPVLVPLPEHSSMPLWPNRLNENKSVSANSEPIESPPATDSDNSEPGERATDDSFARERRGSPLPDSMPSAPMRQGVPGAARAVGSQKPEYPREAWEQGLEGRVVDRMHVAADGRVDQAKIVESSGHRILDDNTLRFALALRFIPARLGDTPVPAEVELPVRYRLVGSR